MSRSRLVAGVFLAAISVQTGAACTQVTSSKLTTMGVQGPRRAPAPQDEPVSQAERSPAPPSKGAAPAPLRTDPFIASSKPLEKAVADSGQSQPETNTLELKTSEVQKPPDPLAPLNHKVLKFNADVDDKAFHPVASGWAKVVPQPARRCIRRFFDNASFVPRFTNAAFQLKLKDAGGELARFGINSTLGVAGFFDPADKWFGIKEHDNDFGKTLAVWGMSGGLFVVMPVAGPINVRRALGHFVDGTMNPMNYLVPGSAAIYSMLAHSIEGLNERAETLDKFEGVSLGSGQSHPAALASPELYDAVRANFLNRESQKDRGPASGVEPTAGSSATAGDSAGDADQAIAPGDGAAAIGSVKASE